MTTSKAAAGRTAATSQPGQECCMCGDFGLPSELFRCEVCQFRSQHRYCSNLYPKSEAYRVCNWCLSGKNESGEKTQNSFNTSSSNRTNTSDDQEDVKTIKKKNGNNHGSLRKGAVKLHDIKNSIKKPRSPERLSLLAARKRITTTITTTNTTTSDPMEGKLRRTKSSEQISNGGNRMIRKPVFRNKVRRYKLLDEVSSL